jgi:protein ImuA
MNIRITMFMAPAPQADYPAPAPLLEEACAARIGDVAATLAFALARIGDPAGLTATRLSMIVMPKRWLIDHGRPFAPAIAPADAGLLLIVTHNETDALWAMEQGLRSGAVAGVIGMIDRATLTQTRRLDFAAREGGSVAVLLRSADDGLSAARRRWRIATLPAAADPLDPRAPGRWRVRADLVRRRDGPPGHWMLEQDDGTNRLRLADRLADHGLVADGRSHAAA